MSDDERLRFEEWANERGLPLDIYFFANQQPYEDPATELAFDAWNAALQQQEPQ